MRKLLFILLFLPFVSQAQDSYSSDSVSNSPILKFSHLSLVDPLPSVQFAFEYQIAEKVSMQHEAGFVSNLFYNDPLYRKARGVRLRNEVRFFLQSKQGPLEGFYIAPELLYIYFEHEREATVEVGCDDLGCDYFQEVTFPVQQQVYALHSKIGYQSIFKRLVVDLYAGIGYRFVRVRNQNVDTALPGNLEVEDEYFEFRKEEGDYHQPSAALGFKIGFVLNGQ